MKPNRLCVAIALAASLAAWPAASASATGRPAQVRLPGPAPRPAMVGPSAARSVPRYVTSQNWSGYVDQADTSVQLYSVSAQFKVPATTCPGYGYDASFWVGLDGYPHTNPTVEQAGVDAYCVISSPSGVEPEYYDWFQMYPSGSVNKFYVSPGDNIKVSVSYDSSNHRYYIQINDTTDPSANVNTNQACPSGETCHNSSAEVIAEDPGNGPSGGQYLSDFGTVHFNSAQVISNNGTIGTLASNSLWSTHEIVMEYPGTRIMAQPSSRTNSYTAFSDSWQSAG